MLDQPLGGDTGHGVVGVVHALATGIAQREGQALLDLLRARRPQAELVVVAHDSGSEKEPRTGKRVVCSAMGGPPWPEHEQNTGPKERGTQVCATSPRPGLGPSHLIGPKTATLILLRNLRLNDINNPD